MSSAAANNAQPNPGTIVDADVADCQSSGSSFSGDSNGAVSCSSRTPLLFLSILNWASARRRR
jgi:hypothetical protein